MLSEVQIAMSQRERRGGWGQIAGVRFFLKQRGRQFAPRC